MKKIIISTVIILGLIGCNDTKKEPKKETFKTISFYESNKAIRNHRIKECKRMVEITETILIDCNNAKKAAYKQKKRKRIDWDF